MTARNREVTEKVQQLCKLGVPVTRIAKELGIHRNSVYYHIAKVKKAAAAVRKEGAA